MDSMVFYRSFYEAIKELDESDKVKIYDAIFAYALDGEKEELTGVPKSIFTLIKPQIDANIKRRIDGKKGAEYGKLGGRPKKENPIGVTDKNPIGVIEETPRGISAETPNVNVNVNENVNEKGNKKPPKHKYGEYKNVLLTDEELEKLKAEYSDYLEKIENLSNYVASTGKAYKSHYATIRNWARKDQPKKTENKDDLLSMIEGKALKGE